MKIVDTDNFGGDYPNEQVIADNIQSQKYADIMCEALNAKVGGEHALRYYKVVADDYVLVPGFQP